MTWMARTLYPFFSNSLVMPSFSSPSGRGVNLLKMRLKKGYRKVMNSRNRVANTAKARISQSPKLLWRPMTMEARPTISSRFRMNSFTLSPKKVLPLVRLKPYFSSMCMVSYQEKGMRGSVARAERSITANSCHQTWSGKSRAKAA